MSPVFHSTTWKSRRSPGTTLPPFASVPVLATLPMGALVTVLVTVAVIGVRRSALTVAVLVMRAPLGSGTSSCTAMVTVTDVWAVITMPDTRLGGVPSVPPADAGSRVTLPGTKAVLAGTVSVTATLTAFSVPVLVMTMV